MTLCYTRHGILRKYLIIFRQKKKKRICWETHNIYIGFIGIGFLFSQIQLLCHILSELKEVQLLFN